MLARTRRAAALLTAAALGAVALTACSDGDDGPAVSRSAGCEQPAEAPAPGTELGVETGDGTRTYKVWAPPALADGEPLPVVLLYHGTNGTSDKIAAFSTLAETGPARGYLVVAPQGLHRPDDEGRTVRWTVPGVGREPDDVAFTRALVDDVGGRWCVDLDRVHATGFSSGGAFTAYLACRAPELFASLAPMAGANLVRDCPDAAPVPWITFHGTADQFVFYEGLSTPEDPEAFYMAPLEETLAGVAERNGCTGDPVVAEVAEDVTSRTFQGCEADTVAYVVEGGGHTWPGSEDSESQPLRGRTSSSVDAAQVLLDFFDAHRRSAPPTAS